jgi:hypothetical protein
VGNAHQGLVQQPTLAEDIDKHSLQPFRDIVKAILCSAQLKQTNKEDNTPSKDSHGHQEKQPEDGPAGYQP